MTFSIGYQLPDETDSITELCNDYKDSISSVYFSWADENSGRLPICAPEHAEMAKEIQLEEFKAIKAMGKSLVLLFNANCYGESAVSAELRTRAVRLCEFLKKEVEIDSVTTTSPFIADALKQSFGKDLRITASVNMRVGTTKAMAQLADYFDGYYMAKECNRDLRKIEELKSWCDANGKKLHMLANSGCMPYCGFQTFHDNLVAHQNVHTMEDCAWDAMPSPCHKYMRNLPDNGGLAYFLQGTWVRPEDIKFYAPYFDEVKIATRMHSRMRMIVHAYANGRYRGNLLDLTEPAFSRDFPGTVLDATKLPANFHAHTSLCDKNCEACGYCKTVAKDIAVKMDL